MRIKKFNLVCTLAAILIWGIFRTIPSLFVAILLALAAVACGIVSEIFIKTKKEKANPDEVEAIGAKAITHYALTFVALSVVFCVFGVFYNNAFGYYSFGSGSYGFEIGFSDVGEIIPDSASAMRNFILPIALIVFAAYSKSIAFCAAGLMSWIGVLIINTSKVFGEYTVVAASGKETLRQVTIYNFSNTVITALCILAVAMFILAIVDLIVFKPKKVAFWCILISMFVAGLLFSYMGYNSYTTAKTFDVETIREDLYVTSKEGSEEFQAENFNNSYGSPSTKCAHAGCKQTIVSSGNSNCCAAHSNRCGNCHQYIDGDALFCMDCIKSALR